MSTNDSRELKPVERIDSVKFLGCNVMAGRYPDGDVEVRLWATSPVNPVTASEEVNRRLFSEVAE